MNWSDLKGIIGKAAPILGTLVGGPAGAAVGGLIAAGLGVDATPDAVSDALLKNPDAYVALQKIEADSKIQLQQLTVTAEQNRLQSANAQYAAEAADRDSARKLAAEQPGDFMRPALAVGVLLLTAYIVWAILSGYSEAIIKDTTAALTVGTLIGYVISELKQVYGFYFGMTKDASSQNAAITSFAVTPGSVTTPDTSTTVQTNAAVTVDSSPLDRVQP